MALPITAGYEWRLPDEVARCLSGWLDGVLESWWVVGGVPDKLCIFLHCDEMMRFGYILPF